MRTLYARIHEALHRPKTPQPTEATLPPRPERRDFRAEYVMEHSKLVLNGDTSTLEAEVNFDLLALQIEVPDSEGHPGDIVRAMFMPTKKQAGSLGELLLRFARA